MLSVKPLEEGAHQLAKQLAALGYEGFVHVRSCGWQKNPAVVLVAALAQPELEARLFEALPWVMVRYTNISTEWLMQQAKLRDLQNRLGFVTTLAREWVEQQTSGDTDHLETLRKLEDSLEKSKLAKVEPLSTASLGP